MKKHQRLTIPGTSWQFLQNGSPHRWYHIAFITMDIYSRRFQPVNNVANWKAWIKKWADAGDFNVRTKAGSGRLGRLWGWGFMQHQAMMWDTILRSFQHTESQLVQTPYLIQNMFLWTLRLFSGDGTIVERAIFSLATEKTCTLRKDTHLALAIPNDINKSNASRRCLRVLAWMIAGSTWEQMEEHPWTVAILGTKTVKFTELLGKGVLKQLLFFPPQGNSSHLIAWCSVFKKVFFGLRSG